MYIYVCINCVKREKTTIKVLNKKERYKLNLEGIRYDIIDTSSFMLHAIFSQYFLPANKNIDS